MAHIVDIDLEQNGVAAGELKQGENVHSDPAEDIMKAKSALQDGRPVFVPTFFDLRLDCLSLVSAKLKTLEKSIVNMQAGVERDAAIEKASLLLQDFDKHFDTVINRHQLAMPDYAEQRGFRVYNFAVDHGDRKEDWLMLARLCGQNSQSIMESEVDDQLHKEWMTDFNGKQGTPVIAFRRRKTLHERQWRALGLESGILVPKRWMILVWKILIPLGVLCFAALIGIMVVANTTTMSPIFEKYFFWFGILWAILSTVLLAGLVRVFGGSSRDCVVACLATVGLCLVGAQLGQLQLANQLEGAS